LIVRLLQTHNGNLRTIPLTGGPSGSQPQARHPVSKRLRLTNLSHLITFDDLSKMTTICGNVKTIQLDGSNAVVEFMDVASADRFVKLYNGKMIKNTMVNVAKI
jgi:hypothetical protein